MVGFLSFGSFKEGAIATGLSSPVEILFTLKDPFEIQVEILIDAAQTDHVRAQTVHGGYSNG
jgi:hypothetical protein